MIRRASTLCAWLGVFGAGCDEAPPRPQVELFVDLDMALPLQLTDTVSADAAVDTLRIDVFTAGRTPVDSRIVSLSTVETLPLSLGIPSSVAQDGVIVRIRAFRAIFATPGDLDDAVVLDPRPEVTVDRLVALTMPDEGIETTSVVLHGDCIGIPVVFGVGGEPDRTCIDESQLSGLSTDAITPGAPATSAAGTWAKAQTQPCEAEPPPGAICIPGGLTILGDLQFLPATEFEKNLAPIPLRVVWLDPFFIDRTEVTVGELRDLVANGYAGPLPDPPEPTHPQKKDCTWDPASDPNLPIGCIGVEVADEVCARRGGAVASEAQWEHTARGRGARRLYPWGSDNPVCCSVSAARFAGGGCPADGIEPVGSHLGEGDCDGDVSRDGVVDLAGSMTELVRDSLASFGDPCWVPGAGSIQILENPVCIGATGRIGRGGSWDLTFGDLPLPIRHAFFSSHPGNGFRCVYEASP